MITNLFILAEGDTRSMFSIASPLLLLAYVVFIALITVAVIVFLRFLGSGMREIRLMRLEIGKLAEELRLLRHELESHTQNGSSGQR